MRVVVTHGANEQTLNDLSDGTTVGQIRTRCSQGLNIPSGAQATINGANVADNTAVSNNQQVCFFKASGNKG